MSRNGSDRKAGCRHGLRSLDLDDLRYEPLAERPSKVSLADLGRPGAGSSWFADWLEYPAQAAGGRRSQAAERCDRSCPRMHGRPVVAALGGHVVKTGCGPYLVDWIERGILRGSR